MGSQKDIEETTRKILRLIKGAYLNKSEYKPSFTLASLDRDTEQNLFNQIKLRIDTLVTSVKCEMVIQETQRITHLIENYTSLNSIRDETGGGYGP